MNIKQKVKELLAEQGISKMDDEYTRHAVYGDPWTPEDEAAYQAFMEVRQKARERKGKTVHHIDGNPLNNAPSNLRIVELSK